MNEMPRIQTVGTVLPTTLSVTSAGTGRPSPIDLGPWIVSGDELLAPPAHPDVFVRTTLAGCDSLVTWDDDTGDLAIDALHLEALAEEQDISTELGTLHREQSR